MQRAENSTSSWGFVGTQPQRGRARSSGRPTAALSIRDGAYVTAEGRPSVLFRVQNGRRQPVEPTDVAAMGITQKDIQEVDPLVLRTMPLELTRQRTTTTGGDLQFHLWSDLDAGHFMESWAWLQGTTLTLKTQTQTVTWFGGYTGGVSAVLFDASGNRILHDPIRYRYGIDGRAFGSGSRENTETAELAQNVADAAEYILIAHYWDPKVDLVATIIEAARRLGDVIITILEKQQQGEQVNAGGDQF